MLQMILVGNLGADAQVRESNGKKFLSLSVSHNDKYFDSKLNKWVESTTWVGVTLNRFSDNLVQYLVKGSKVYVAGRGKLRIYFDSKHVSQAGLDIMADTLELLATPITKASVAGGTSSPEEPMPFAPADTNEQGF